MLSFRRVSKIKGEGSEIPDNLFFLKKKYHLKGGLEI